MSLSSIEYKELLLDFEKDLSKIAEDLYEASTEKISEDKKRRIVAAGKGKLAMHEDLLSKLAGVRKAEAEKQFSRLITLIRRFLADIEKK